MKSYNENMKNVCKDLFQAIYEDKWISIEYINQNGQLTKYWIGVKDIQIGKKIMLTVDGLHLALGSVAQLHIDLQSIQFSCVLDGSYYAVPTSLKEDIENNPEKYSVLFDNVANLKILNYLSDCNRLDNVPYKKEYSLISLIDDDKVRNGNYSLSDEQFLDIVKTFQISVKNRNRFKATQLCLNILSINTKQGLYVLAYRQLNFDVLKRCFMPEEEINICEEFTVAQQVTQSIRYFLNEDEQELLGDFKNNLQQIEDCILANCGSDVQIDDMPYLIAISRDMPVSLEEEFSEIQRRMMMDEASYPLRAFFGELIKVPQRKKNYPITLLNNKVNLDQLLSIHHAMKYPITYVQGPPGTGKTNTIINTILTAFFNEKTLLFTSYNNHPIDGVMDKLTNITYQGFQIPFPILRIGNGGKMLATLNYIKNIFSRVKDMKVPEEAYQNYIDSLKMNTSALTELMVRYEEIIELKERKETIEKLLESNSDFNFQLELQTKQLNEIEQRLLQIGEVRNEEALQLVVDDELFKKTLTYMSIATIQHLGEPKFEELWKIIDLENDEDKIICFNKYIGKEENLMKLMKAFPIIASTCISAHKLGRANDYFDMVVMDEASQCNSAIALIPIMRGRNLLLVGDPQQLNPVIVLDPKDNEILKKKYGIKKEYDYISNSIYKTFLGCDSISQEILLSHHYRCDKRIIDFCNRKYYNNRLSVDTPICEEKSLMLVDVKDNVSSHKNTSLREADTIIAYLKDNPDKSIGIITPFVNQKKVIDAALKANHIENVSCGTVHAFQGDEKDEIIFSLALSNKSSTKTYQWLKNNKELINVGVSRARKKLILMTSLNELSRLHYNRREERDDLYELAQYALTNGQFKVSVVENNSRALGIKPYSSETEEVFMMNLNHALENVISNQRKCVIRKEVAIASVFENNPSFNSLFYSGRFDFVVFEKEMGQEFPILAIELDGKEHYTEEVVKQRDAKKNAICKEHGFELIRVDNSYARRYNYIKEILMNYFSS